MTGFDIVSFYDKTSLVVNHTKVDKRIIKKQEKLILTLLFLVLSAASLST